MAGGDDVGPQHGEAMHALTRRVPVRRQRRRRMTQLARLGHRRRPGFLVLRDERVAGEKRPVGLMPQRDVTDGMTGRVQRAPAAELGHRPVFRQGTNRGAEIERAVGERPRHHRERAADRRIGRGIMRTSGQVREFERVGVDRNLPEFRQPSSRSCVVEMTVRENNRPRRTAAVAPCCGGLQFYTPDPRQPGVEQHPAGVRVVGVDVDQIGIDEENRDTCNAARGYAGRAPVLGLAHVLFLTEQPSRQPNPPPADSAIVHPARSQR